MKKSNSSSTVLLSGGMDSVIAFFVAIQENERVNALAINYGQRNAAQELPRARRIHQQFAPPGSEFRMINFDASNLAGQSPLIRHKVPVTNYDDVQAAKIAPRDPAFIAARNHILISFGANWAVGEWDDRRLYTGLRAGSFPDSTYGFTDALSDALSIGMFGVRNKFDIISPLQSINRAGSIRLAQEMPGTMEALGMSWTCFEAAPTPCGKCLPCLKRAEAFADWGLVDPALAYVKGIDN